MYEQTSSTREYQGITRTICIGIGGTGRDVLMRIRRLIVDRYGRLNELPLVGFVHIDTDSTGAKVSGLRTGNTYHGEDLSFRDAEKVNATMTAAEVSKFIEGMERRTGDSPGPYNHIAQWFPPQLLRNIRAIEQGAQGIRPVGRLAFFHNYLKIKKAIDSAEQRTKGYEQYLFKHWNLRVDPGLNIFIVGSLCGGTGSGMFLDTAYSLRNAYTGVQIVGYLVISPELYGNTPNMCANTYAALMELDYYSSPGTKFQVCYDQHNLQIVQEKRPPFDYAYLVANHTAQQNYSIHAPGKLCNVIANKIALEFSGELAPAVKGMRDNFNQYMLQEDEHPRPNHQGYLTFGLAAIYFPRDAIANICTARIKSELLNFWLHGKGQSPDSLSLLNQFLIESRWDKTPGKDRITTRLEATPLEPGKPFGSLMNVWKNRLDSLIAECKSKDDRINATRQLSRDFREQFRKTVFGETENTRGDWLTKLKRGCNTVTEQLAQDIDNFLSALLTAGNPNFSIRNTRNWLDALQSELSEYQRSIEEQVTRLQSDAKKLEDLEKICKETEQAVEDIEKKLLPYGKNSQIQDRLRKTIQNINAVIKHNFTFAVALETLDILKVLQGKVQQHISQMTSLIYLVENLKSTYEQEQTEHKKLNLDEMSGEAIFADEDIENCYHILLPQNEIRAQLAQITEEVIEPIDAQKSLVLIVGNRTTPELLQDTVNLTVDRLFGSRTASIVQSAIKRFHQTYPINGRAARLAQILREAEPLLPLEKDRYFYDDLAKNSRLIGFKDTDEIDIQQFKYALSRELNIAENVFKPTQAEDEVLIISEYAAFPLRLINGLEQLRNHYVRNKSLNFHLHNDQYSLFTDIIPPDVRVLEELQEVFYPCLAFGLIKQNSATGKLEFDYYNELWDESYSVSFSSSWNKALEELANRSDVASALKQIFEKVVAEIDDQPTRWEEEYLKKIQEFRIEVCSFKEDNINYLYRFRVAGTDETTNMPFKEGIIDRFVKKMKNRIESLKMQNQNLITPVFRESQSNVNRQSVSEATYKSVDYNHSLIDPNDNRARRRIEIEPLNRDLQDNVITQEEYNIKLQLIRDKYPV